MRIRSIKPEFWTSTDIAALPKDDRLLFIGLWSYVDDNGVGRDEDHLIVAALFPRDMCDNPRETLASVSRGLQRLSDAGLIVRYITDDRAYLQITAWERHQKIDRPNKPRFPRYDANRETLARPSRDPRETPSSGTEEQGNRGTEETSPLAPSATATPTTHKPDPQPLTRPNEKPKPRPNQGTRLPDDWTPSPALIDWTRRNTPDITNQELDNFRDYWKSKPGQGARKLDWDATWRTWARRAQEQTSNQRGRRNQNQIMADMRKKHDPRQGDALALIESTPQ